MNLMRLRIDAQPISGARSFPFVTIRSGGTSDIQIIRTVSDDTFAGPLGFFEAREIGLHSQPALLPGLTSGGRQSNDESAR